MKQQAGFSLLELLLTLAASSLFLFSIYQLFFHQQQQYHQQQRLLAMQENKRLALHILHNTIQGAGDAGCLPVSHLHFHNNIVQLSVDAKIAQGYAIYGFHGHEGGWTPALPAQLIGKVATQTDVIWVEKASYERANLTQTMRVASDPIYISQKKLFEIGDVVLIADCKHADLFTVNQVSEYSQGQILHPNQLSRHYGKDAQVMRWEIDSYYLAPHSQDPLVLALYQKKILPDTAAVELAFGFDTFNVEYALLSKHTPEFLKANTVLDWQKVTGLVLSIETGHLPSQLNIVLHNVQG